MRTTVELSDPVYRRLRRTAAERGLRGLSPIVEEALLKHLDELDGRPDLAARIRAAGGSWSEADVAEWECARSRAWAGWRTSPS